MALVFWVLLNLFGLHFVWLWLGSSDLFEPGLVLTMTTYGVFLAHVHLGIALATALGLVERLALIAFIEAIINLVTSIVLVQMLGPLGVSLGTLIAAVCGPTLLVTLFVLKPALPKILQETKSVLVPIFKKNLLFVLLVAYLVLNNFALHLSIKILVMLAFLAFNFKEVNLLVTFKSNVMKK